MKSILEYEKPSKTSIILLILLAAALAAAVVLTLNNHGYYNETLARVTSLSETHESVAYGVSETKEDHYLQKIEAIVLNGEYKGRVIYLENERSGSGVYDETLKDGDEIFVSLDESSGTWTYVKSSAIHFLHRLPQFSYLPPSPSADEKESCHWRVFC